MADNNSKTFISGIVIFAVLVILGFTFFAGKEETAPVITDGVVVEATDMEEVESSEDAAVELDQIVPVETPAVVEETVTIEEAPAQETVIEEVKEDAAAAGAAIEETATDAVEAVEDAATEAKEAVEEAVDNVDVQPAQ